jgi:hypothetical protein
VSIWSPPLVTLGVLTLLAGTNAVAFAENATDAKPQPLIQDNSFLIEEAYNQERGVVQHISTFSRMWNSKDWCYTFTQEWPGPWSWRHQFSYTLQGMHAGSYGGSGAGFGDVLVNYRFQVAGNGESRAAFAPRLSMMLPTGNTTWGRGAGAVGIQTNLPLSVVLHRRLITHWNVGGAYVPNARSGADGVRAGTMGYNLGQSFVFVAHPRVNILLETAHTGFQSITGPGKTRWEQVTYLSPGVRWSYNFRSGLQIVPGVAVPMGIGASAGERGLFLYLSFEHPFPWLRHK